MPFLLAALARGGGFCFFFFFLFSFFKTPRPRPAECAQLTESPESGAQQRPALPAFAVAAGGNGVRIVAGRPARPFARGSDRALIALL